MLAQPRETKSKGMSTGQIVAIVVSVVGGVVVMGIGVFFWLR